MKYLLFTIALSISTLTIGQNEKGITISTDTIHLKKFKSRKVIEYSTHNETKIVIDKRDFLDELALVREKFIKTNNESELKGFGFNANALRTIDSTHKKITGEITTKKSIISKYRTCNQVGLDIVFYFNTFIDNGTCALYDQNGTRRYTVIKKVRQYKIGDDKLIFNEYYFLNETESFYQ